eukprot:TRINITY_DN113476_c0_g1_i1.p1 TRINITY_DN113476_c0_g1~~TRINITY_DN113476_c0_g1_i1.p1  ORF type:complete len:182 (+),score=35.15 TRINITY_DN113476_c0_g1_i1:119-664(+)
MCVGVVGLKVGSMLVGTVSLALHGTRYVANCCGAKVAQEEGVGGNSMVAGAAIWAAVVCPRVVAGLVLYQLPIVWEARIVRRGVNEAVADVKQAEDPCAADVLLVAARTDIHQREELKVVDVHVLVASARDDPEHPASSAKALAALWPKATLVATDKKADSPLVFASSLGSWMESQVALNV